MFGNFFKINLTTKPCALYLIESVMCVLLSIAYFLWKPIAATSEIATAESPRMELRYHIAYADCVRFRVHGTQRLQAAKSKPTNFYTSRKGLFDLCGVLYRISTLLSISNGTSVK